MKTIKLKILIPAGFLAASLLLSVDGFSQTKRLPDGTVVYNDGSRKLPNGTVIYKNGTVKKRVATAKLPDGKVLLPDGSVRYPEHKSYKHRNNSRFIPPGQAKKMYGGRAADYAPGHQKKWKKGHKNHK
ncbi:MAG: hypothetical protein ABIO55_00605 [Ginsengibacter sp.]